MYNANLTADDIRALDKIKDLPAALREQVEQIKKTLPVSVEVPRDFYEDMQRRAVAPHSTPELLIVQFCRRWISAQSSSTKSAQPVSYAEEACAHYESLGRRAVKDAPSQSIPHKEEFKIENLGMWLEERKISYPEISDYSGVNSAVICQAVNRDSTHLMWKKHKNDVITAINMILSGEIVTDWQIVSEGTLFRYIQQYQRENRLTQAQCCDALHISTQTYRNAKNRVFIGHASCKKLRKTLKI